MIASGLIKGVLKMAKRGRQPIQLTKELLNKVELMASRGLNDYEIFANLGWAKDTFYRKKKLYSEFSDALERGRANGHLQVSNKLFEACMKSNVQAIQFYLARKCNWTEPKHESENDGDEAPALNINFNVNEAKSEVKVTKGK